METWETKKGNRGMTNEEKIQTVRKLAEMMAPPEADYWAMSSAVDIEYINKAGLLVDNAIVPGHLALGNYRLMTGTLKRPAPPRGPEGQPWLGE